MVKRVDGRPLASIGAGLLLMSISSGCMDVLSYRFLGEVFTSAMTGNVALLGMRLGEDDPTDAFRNAAAFGGFVCGLLIGAALLPRGAERGRLIAALTVQLVLLLAFAGLWPLHGSEVGRYALITMSALAMGVQSAVAHRFGVQGVSTTYFTGTLVNIVFGLLDPPAVANPASPPIRRVAWPLLAFTTYVIGAAGAGWYTLGGASADLRAALPLLPCAATAVLIVIVVLALPKRKA